MSVVKVRTCCHKWEFKIPKPAIYHFKDKFTSSFSEVIRFYFADFEPEKIKAIIVKALSKYPPRFRTTIHFEMMVKYIFRPSAEGNNVKYFKYKIGSGDSPASIEQCQQSDYTGYSPPIFPYNFISAPLYVPPRTTNNVDGNVGRIGHPCTATFEQLLYGNGVGATGNVPLGSADTLDSVDPRCM